MKEEKEQRLEYLKQRLAEVNKKIDEVTKRFDAQIAQKQAELKALEQQPTTSAQSTTPVVYYTQQSLDEAFDNGETIEASRLTIGQPYTINNREITVIENDDKTVFWYNTRTHSTDGLELIDEDGILSTVDEVGGKMYSSVKKSC